MNPVLAPRHPRCSICKSVASVEDVTLRLYDEALNHLPITAARQYCQAIGLDGTPKALDQRIRAHRKHVDRFLERGAAVAPAHIEEGISRIPAPAGPTRWVDVNQRGMDVGDRALTILEERLRIGLMEDRDIIAAAKLGQSAARTRADLEMKGAMKRAEAIARLASGFSPPAE